MEMIPFSEVVRRAAIKDTVNKFSMEPNQFKYHTLVDEDFVMLCFDDSQTAYKQILNVSPKNMRNKFAATGFLESVRRYCIQRCMERWVFSNCKP